MEQEQVNFGAMEFAPWQSSSAFNTYWQYSFVNRATYYANIHGEYQLVKDLELMIWNKYNDGYDDSVPNDCADAFRYAVCTYYTNPDNLWETPNEFRRY